MLLGAGLGCVLAACADPRPGTVHGDAFIAENVDAWIELPGMAVHLVPDTEEVLDSAIARLCPARDASAAAADPLAARERAWRARAALLRGLAVRRAETDSAARFAMDSVPAGAYRLWADTVVGGDRWTWLAPVQVTDGDSVRVNLTNANPDETPFLCG